MKRLFFISLLFAACSDEFYNDMNDVEGSYDPSSRCVNISWDDQDDVYYEVVRKCYGDCDGTGTEYAKFNNLWQNEFKDCLRFPNISPSGKLSFEYTIYSEGRYVYDRKFIGNYETPDIERATIAH